MKQLGIDDAAWALIDRVVGGLDAAVRGGRVPNPLVASASQGHVRGKLRLAAAQGNVFTNDEWFIFAEPGTVWFSREPALFENLVYPLTSEPAWGSVPGLLRSIARLHGVKHVLFGDMFGVAAPHYRQAAGVKALGRSFITTV